MAAFLQAMVRVAGVRAVDPQVPGASLGSAHELIQLMVG